MPLERLKHCMLFLVTLPGILLAQTSQPGKDSAGGAAPEGAINDGWGWIWFWIAVVVVIIIIAAVWSSGRKRGGKRGSGGTARDPTTRVDGSGGV